MKTVSNYVSMVVEYDNSYEMSGHIQSMEAYGWKATSISYGKLRVRYRMEIIGGELNVTNS
jgi:hypothetical protein